MNYKEILKNVLENGVPKQPTRVVNGKVEQVQNPTIGTFGEVFRHDMSEGFPLSTLRKLPFKSTVVELEFFMRGLTDKRWLEERGCKYWSEFSSDLYRPKGQSKRDHWSLGPLGYSAEWRDFGGWLDADAPSTDQLAYIVNLLKNHPYDRRMVVSFWNPNSMEFAALPSCHLLHNVVVYGDTLNLCWHQRSCDIMLNASITTYGLLLLMYAKVAGLRPGVLQGTFADCHLYENQIEAAKILVEREEKPLPTVDIPDDFDILDWTHDQIKLIGYDPWPAVQTGAITV
jgi:thymidylate synthase